MKSHYDRDADGKLDIDSKAVLKNKIKTGLVITDNKGIPYTEETLPDDALLTLPRSQDEYKSFFRTIHSLGSYKVENPDELLSGLTTETSLTRDQLARSYVRIHVSTVGASNTIDPKAL